MFKNMNLFTKILALGISIVVAFTLVIAWFFPKFKTTLYDGKYTKTQHIVESAHSVIKHFATQAASGSLTEDEAKELAKGTIESMRYDGSQYFWIQDTSAVMIMHPIKPELNGKDLSESKDPTGKRLFAEFARVAQEDGEGFVDYQWAKTAGEDPSPKISFVKLFPKWNWIVASGIYIDDVEKEIWATMSILLTIVGFLFVGSLAFAIMLAKSITKPISLVVENLNSGSKQTTAASNQISSSAQLLSQGTTTQASSLEETSSSLEEISSMTKQNAENADNANKMSVEARGQAEKGGEAMKDMQIAMSGIAESSDKVSKIIKTIEEIAFQTNLLALNAAVEAARAGEHGKGFAVVAEEVRNLAQRAGVSARETSQLIAESTSRSKEGADICSRATVSLDEIIVSSKKVADVIAEIAAASKEQSDGITQITSAISQMDQVTQQNAATSEETAASAEELSSQAAALQDMVIELSHIIGGANAVVDSGFEPRGQQFESMDFK